MASPIRNIWEAIPKKIRSGITTLLKAVLTILAFYLLLSHHVNMVDHRSVQLDSGQILQLNPGDSIRIGNHSLVLKTGEKAVDAEKTTFKIKTGMRVHLSDGRTAKVLPLDRETTFSAIVGYLPKIRASTFWTFVLLAAFIKFIGILCSMYRWHLLLQGQGIRFPFFHLVGSFLIGRFLGTFLPSTIGLDGYKLYDATRFSKRAVEATAATVIEKVLGIVGIFITFLVALPFGISILGKQAGTIAMLTVPVALGIIIIFFLLLFYPAIIQWLIENIPIPGKQKIQGFIQRVSKSAAAYRNKKLLLLNAAFQSFMVHFCTAAMYFFTAAAIGALGASFWQVTFASSIQIFATVISPITIAGEGIREIAQYYLLRNQMGPAESIVSAALGFWAAEALTLFGGVFWWIRKSDYRPKFLYLDGRAANLEELMSRKDYGLEELQHREENLPRGWWKTAFFPRVYAGLSAGFLAGVLLGLLESVWIMAIHGCSFDIFPYGMILYGIIGAGAGLGAGIGFGVFALALGQLKGTRNVFALVLAGWFAANFLILGKFRLFRDVWKEQALPLSAKLSLAAAALAVFLIFFLLAGRKAENIKAKSLRAVGAASVLILLGFISLGIASVFSNPGETEPPAVPEHLKSKPNAILIMCDALRADYLGIYGDPSANTDAIDTFARSSVRFQSAYSQASWTKPGTASLFTGLFPSGHNTNLKPDILPDSVDTIAEVFQKAGYHTVGFPNNINVSPGFNFGQGFDQYTYLEPDYFFFATDASSQLTYYSILRLIRERFIFKTKYPQNYYQEAEVVNEHVLKYLDTRGTKERFFLYLHYMEAHDPYFEHPFNGVGYARVDMPNPDPSFAAVFQKTYREEVTYLSEKLGELFRELKKRGLWDNTIIVLTADHGEELFDHEGWWHGTTLYQEQISIPLIIKFPDSKHANEVRLDNARQIDIAPTLLSLCGIPPSDKMRNGRNLFSPADPYSKEWEVLSQENLEGNVLSSLIRGPWKIIRANKGNPRGLAEKELYRLDIDPYERTNLAEQEHDSHLPTMEHALEDAETQAVQGAAKRQVKQISPEELNRMKALGYVQE